MSTFFPCRFVGNAEHAKGRMETWRCVTQTYRPVLFGVGLCMMQTHGMSSQLLQTLQDSMCECWAWIRCIYSTSEWAGIWLVLQCAFSVAVEFFVAAILTRSWRWQVLGWDAMCNIQNCSLLSKNSAKAIWGGVRKITQKYVAKDMICTSSLSGWYMKLSRRLLKKYLMMWQQSFGQLIALWVCWWPRVGSYLIRRWSTNVSLAWFSWKLMSSWLGRPLKHANVYGKSDLNFTYWPIWCFVKESWMCTGQAVGWMRTRSNVLWGLPKKPTKEGQLIVVSTGGCWPWSRNSWNCWAKLKKLGGSKRRPCIFLRWTSHIHKTW